MSAWDQFDQHHQQRRAKRKRLAAGALAFLGLASLAGSLLIPRWLANPKPPELSEISASSADTAAASRADGNLSERAEQVTAGAQTAVSPRSSFAAGAAPGSQAAVEARLDRLAENLREHEVAAFKKQAAETHRGPQTISYTVSGSGQDHYFSPGRATFGDTDIVGAAGEWVVRPWWQPGWVPNSADCGEVGTAAIAGHVSWAGRPGPFHDLGAMTAGDEIRCQSSRGRWHIYTVTEVVRIDYANTDYVQQTLKSNGRELTLFSCTPEITGIIVVRAAIGG